MKQANVAAGKLRSFGAVVYLVDGAGQYIEPQLPANDEIADSGSQAAAVAEVAEVAEGEVAAESSSEDGDNTDPYNLTATAKVRHLEQITDKRVLEQPAPINVRKTRWRYQETGNGGPSREQAHSVWAMLNRRR